MCVQVMLNTRAKKHSDGSYVTGDGEQLEPHHLYMTVGGTPNTAFLRGSHLALDERGHIKVRHLGSSKLTAFRRQLW